MTAVAFVLMVTGWLLFALLDPQNNPDEPWRGHVSFWPLVAGFLLVIWLVARWLWTVAP